MKIQLDIIYYVSAIIHSNKYVRTKNEVHLRIE